MNDFYAAYQLLWAILALGGGILMLCFRERFIRGNIRICEYLYKKTRLSWFKLQAEGMDSTYMRLVTVIVAVFFIYSGVQIFLEYL
jgi:hypothetical protein